jgi:hypothetical protein
MREALRQRQYHTSTLTDKLNIKVIVLYNINVPKVGFYINSGITYGNKLFTNEEINSHYSKLNIQKLVYYMIGV